MAKIDPLSDVVNLQSETTAVQTLNENSDKIEAAFNNTLSRDGSGPNAMTASIDLNGHVLLNVGTPANAGDGVNKGYVDELVGGISPEILANLEDLPDLVNEAVQAADDAAASAIEAASYVGAAESAPHWTTARTITATGDIVGVSPPWDGSANLSFTLTLPNGVVSASKLGAGAVISNLGYTPLPSTGGTLTGQLINNHNPTSSLDAKAVGFRGVPIKYQNATWAFTLADCGTMLRHDSATGHVYGIDPISDTPYPIGYAVMVRNVGVGNVLLYRGAGVQLYKDGSGVSADVTVSQWGKCTLIHEGSNIWTVGGTGIS